MIQSINSILIEAQRESHYLCDIIQNHNTVQASIRKELDGILGANVLKDMKDTLAMYSVYQLGAGFDLDRNSNDWTPSQWRAHQIKTLIDKEARFMFSIPPQITLKGKNDVETKGSEELLKAVLKKNNFNSKLVRGAKDCLVGKRLAIVVNFNSEYGINIDFIPSLGFVYETDIHDNDLLTKFIQFHMIKDTYDRKTSRVYKKKWEMVDGVCHVYEGIYDSVGMIQETLIEDLNTGLPFIPVAIVINDGLSGDVLGVSDVAELIESESVYAKLSNKDIDSLRKGTDQITYAIDADPRTTKGLSRAAGAFWDLATDPTKDDKTAQVGTLDNPMGYASALDQTLARIKTDMHAQLGVPDTSNRALQGVITSGKTMQAVYWDLKVRCDEKMLDWAGAFESMVQFIVEGAKLFPHIAKLYTKEHIQSVEATIINTYPILQDESEDKANGMMEVNHGIRSRKSYLKKWYNLTDEEVAQELKQVQLEKEMIEQETYPSEEVEEREGSDR